MELQWRDHLRAAQQPAEQVRWHLDLAGPEIRPGQREDPAEGLCPPEHAVVLWRGGLRRSGHQVDAELGKTQFKSTGVDRLLNFIIIGVEFFSTSINPTYN